MEKNIGVYEFRTNIEYRRKDEREENQNGKI